MSEIVIDRLSKQFGAKRALQTVSLQIEDGMFGLLGRNGAGKTTLMRILATLLRETSGSVEICGISTRRPREIRRIVGYLPQDFCVYPNMSVFEAMDYLGTLSGLPRAPRRERIADALRKVNLDDCRRIRVKALSGGMRRRLGIAQAILHDPRVLIVDEPTAGLDPEERVRLRALLCDIAASRVVLLSTHIVEDVEKTCKRIAVLDRGQIVYQGSLQEYIGADAGLEEAYLRRMGGASCSEHSL